MKKKFLFILTLLLTAVTQGAWTQNYDKWDGVTTNVQLTGRKLWKDGKWIYRYNKASDGKDGTLICRRNGVTDEEIEAGVAKGILSCADYFVAPAEG